MSNRRPRRSRIYDLNYNIGENYYKSALDRLDEKVSRPSAILRRSEPPVSLPRSRIANLAGEDGIHDDLDFARERAKHAIQRETILDQRTGRKAHELETDFDGQVQRTLDRIQASKKLLNSIDLENGYENNNEAALTSSIMKKRTLKVTSDISSSSAAQSSNESRSKYSSRYQPIEDSESFAASRARQSLARLHDIEQDMQERSDRQLVREQRAANVKKLLAETGDFGDVGLENGISSLKITKTTQKRITSY